MTTPAHVYRRDKTGTACAYAGCTLTEAQHGRHVGYPDCTCPDGAAVHRTRCPRRRAVESVLGAVIAEDIRRRPSADPTTRIASVHVSDICIGDVTMGRRGDESWRAPVTHVERYPRSYLLTFADGSAGSYPLNAHIKIKIERPS